MNLQDVLNEEGLQQDEWSLIAPTFGKEGQLTVLGWSGRNKRGKGDKYYILKCNTCTIDSELYGNGYFKATKANLKAGNLPCGCGGHPRRSKEQYSVLCERKAKDTGYKFLGFEGYWDGNTTTVRLECKDHGEWSSSTINRLLRGVGCPVCADNIRLTGARISDDVMIRTFLNSGGFHPNTEFWRSDKKTKQGTGIFWFMSCPDCGEVGEAVSYTLQLGKRCCACSIHRQQEAYINWVIDNEGVVLAIKFGITQNSKRRAKQQDSRSTCNILNFMVYIFPTVEDCKKAEKECKSSLDCGIVPKDLVQDGYTETTQICNLFRIIEIYKRNRGVIKKW